MVKDTPPGSVLGSYIMNSRKERNLTQADLADRFNVSVPAIFKFEKGFVTPSLKLWLRIAAEINIPEKKAVLLWVREKLPRRIRKYAPEPLPGDIDALVQDLTEASRGADAHEGMRRLILASPDVAPALRRFVENDVAWDTLKPTIDEVIFLLGVEELLPDRSPEDFRDLLLVARRIKSVEV